MQQTEKFPITLITAPAGYGKSTLVGPWLDSLDKPSFWYSLDKEDSDPRIFLDYLLEVLPDSETETYTTLKSILKAPEFPSLQYVATQIVNHLNSPSLSGVLVLDDLHRLDNNSGVHEFLRMIADHPPESLQIVIITRRDPPYSLIKAEANGYLHNIRMQDLKFSLEETASLVRDATDIVVSDEAIDNLELQVEGWIVGLRLLLIALAAAEDPDEYLKKLKGGIIQTQEYLLNEVLHQMPVIHREFFLRSSILDRFNKDLIGILCTAESGCRQSAADFLQALQEQNPFAMTLDNHRDWFRYHHLFRDLLSNQLRQDYSSDDILVLHSQVAQWFEDHQMIEESIDHWLLAERSEDVIRLIVKYRYSLIDSEQWIRLNGWQKRIPAEVLEKSAILQSTQTLIYEYQGNWDFVPQAKRALAMCGSGPQEYDDIVRGESAIIDAEMALVGGDSQQIRQHLQTARNYVPSDTLHLQSYLIGIDLLSMQAAGKLEEGLAIAENAVLSSRASSYFFRSRISTWKGLAHMMNGTLREVVSAAKFNLLVGESQRLPESLGFGYYLSGVAYYLMNKLDEAADHLGTLMQHRHTSRPSTVLNGAFVLLMIQRLRDEENTANQELILLSQEAEERGDPLTIGLINAFRANLAWVCGEFDDARKFSRDVLFNPIPPHWYFYIPQLTPIKILISSGTPDSLRNAEIQLQDLIEFCEKAHRNTVLISCLGLMAIIKSKSTMPDEALSYINRALDLAEPGGNIRGLADLGHLLLPILSMVTGAHSDYAARISSIISNQKPAEPDTRVIDDHDLTNREIDCLELAAKRLQDKEIAERLYISEHTVRHHLKKVYGKLYVHGRREAVKKALELKIITQ